MAGIEAELGEMQSRTHEQFEHAQRKMDAIIDEMRNLSQKIILALPRKSMIRTTANRPKLSLS